MAKTQFKDLTIKDAFMFAAVMADEEICRKVIERALGIPIARVCVCTEKTMVYHPEYHGIRMDVYAADENQTRFNIEMQVRLQKFLPKRSRYYHDQMDMDALATGIGYENLPDTYVIFICDFDPFDKGYYRYTSSTFCEEGDFPVRDGAHTIYLSTKGKNDDEVPKELVQFLKYVQNAGKNESKEFQDSLVSELQERIKNLKENRSMEEKYMLLEEMLQEERNEGKVEGKADSICILLKRKGMVPAELRTRFEAEKDEAKLEEWICLAAQVVTVEEFIQKM